MTIPHFVYRCYDADGRLIYVGSTNDPRGRIVSHIKYSWWGKYIAATRVIVFPDKKYALDREREAIATERPRFNVKGKWSSRTDEWTVEDYVDTRRAILMGIASTHGVDGPRVRADLAAIDRELLARFGVTAIGGVA